MTCIIKVIGAEMPGGTATIPESGRYLMDFDVGAHTGRGPIPTTLDPSAAKQFANAGEALEFWKTQSRVRPHRDDGLPNRPLTAFTVEIVKLDE